MTWICVEGGGIETVNFPMLQWDPEERAKEGNRGRNGCGMSRIFALSPCSQLEEQNRRQKFAKENG